MTVRETIRPEAPDDLEGIRSVLLACFDTPAEAEGRVVGRGGEAFQIFERTPGSIPQGAGLVRYAKAFVALP